MIGHDILKPGTRVALVAPPPVLQFERLTGRVIGRDFDEDYYIVELDSPALYRRPDGTEKELRQIREARLNLAPLSDLAGT